MRNLILKITAAILFVAVLVFNYLAVVLPIGGVSTGEAADAYANLFTPAGFTFSIWSLIYLLLLFYVVYQFTKASKKREELLAKVNFWFIVSSIANISWIFAWHYGVIWLSLIIMLVLLTSLIMIAEKMRQYSFPNMLERIGICAPFSIYFGWITVATIANFTIFFVYLGWNGFGLAESLWVSLVLLVGVAIGVWRSQKDLFGPYSLVLIWAYFGILSKHISASGFDSAYPGVIAVISFCLVVLVGNSALVAWRFSFKKKATKKQKRLVFAFVDATLIVGLLVAIAAYNLFGTGKVFQPTNDPRIAWSVVIGEVSSNAYIDKEGNAYYFDKLIAPAKTVANGLAETNFDEVKYTAALVSPTGMFIALPASCWEVDCLYVYDTMNDRLYEATQAASKVHWTDKGLLWASGECYAPKPYPCGPFVSLRVGDPWNMAEWPNAVGQEELITNNGDIWTGVKADTDGDELADTYQLVLNNTQVVAAYPWHECTVQEWSVLDDGNFLFEFGNSPCEAYIQWTSNVFNQNGEPVFGVRHTYPSGTLAFSLGGVEATGDSGDYLVRLMTTNECAEDSYKITAGGVKYPDETELLGFKIGWVDSSGQNQTKEYFLDEPELISCGQYYGEDIGEPQIDLLEITSDSVSFELPDGTPVTASVAESGEPVVIF